MAGVGTCGRSEDMWQVVGHVAGVGIGCDRVSGLQHG